MALPAPIHGIIDRSFAPTAFCAAATIFADGPGYGISFDNYQSSGDPRRTPARARTVSQPCSCSSRS